MKIAYFDCFSGAAGDMILGALLDAGLPLEKLKAELAKLGLSHYRLGVEKVTKNGIGGSRANHGGLYSLSTEDLWKKIAPFPKPTNSC